MKRPYEFDPLTGVAQVCSWHASAAALEAQAQAEHPGCHVSHGICGACLDSLLHRSMEPRVAWLPEPVRSMPIEWIEDARQEIAVVNQTYANR